MLARAGRMGRRPVVGGPAAIKVGTSNLFVYLGGALYKLRVSDLTVDGTVEVEKPDGMENMRRRGDRRRRDDMPERPRKRRKGDEGGDF